MIGGNAQICKAQSEAQIEAQILQKSHYLAYILSVRLKGATGGGPHPSSGSSAGWWAQCGPGPRHGASCAQISCWHHRNQTSWLVSGKKDRTRYRACAGRRAHGATPVSVSVGNASRSCLASFCGPVSLPCLAALVAAAAAWVVAVKSEAGHAPAGLADRTPFVGQNGTRWCGPWHVARALYAAVVRGCGTLVAFAAGIVPAQDGFHAELAPETFLGGGS